MPETPDTYARRRIVRLEQAVATERQRVTALRGDLEVLRDAAARLTVLYGEGRYATAPSTRHEPVGKDGATRRSSAAV